MPHLEDRFPTRDGLLLHENRWLPEGDARAAVVLVHGFVEHSGRYEQLAEALNRHGYAVWAMDLRGHGKSQGRPVFIRSFDDYLDDLDRLVRRVRADAAGRPVFLLGHSMGGAIALLYAVGQKRHVAGVVASAAVVQIGGGVFPFLRRLAAVVARIFPRLRLVQVGSGMLSRDPDVVEDFRNDPLVFHGRFPVRTGNEILRAARRIQQQKEALEVPLLILHGTGDGLTNPEGSRRLFAAAGSHDKTLALFDGLYHDLFHEPEREEVTAEVIAWLNARA